MQLVLDTNVVASGLLWDGKPAQLIDAARGVEVELATSRVLLAELTRILRREKFAKAIATAGASLDDLVLGYAELALLVTPASIPPRCSTILMTIVEVSGLANLMDCS
jgi:putative PIN family toxin of toxin-antitoxin system